MKSSISNLAQKLTTTYWRKFKSILPTLPNYNQVVVEEINKNKIITIEKDNIKIVIGNEIEIIDQNKTITVTKDLNINVTGDVYINVNGKTEITTENDIDLHSNSGTITFKTTDVGVWVPNAIPNCIFAGSPHGGAGLNISKLKNQ